MGNNREIQGQRLMPCPLCHGRGYFTEDGYRIIVESLLRVFRRCGLR